MDLFNASILFETPPKIDPQQRQYVKLYRRVLILDDVVTTGSSIQALTLQLEQLGCHKVSAACIAYALE